MRTRALPTSRTLQLVTLCAAIWAPTFLAELVELSGIVATLFAAIGVRHWATPNLQSSSTVDAKPVANACVIYIGSFGGHDHLFVPRIERAGLCGNRDSTPSTIRLLDGWLGHPHRSTEPDGRVYPCRDRWLISTQVPAKTRDWTNRLLPLPHLLGHGVEVGPNATDV